MEEISSSKSEGEPVAPAPRGKPVVITLDPADDLPIDVLASSPHSTPVEDSSEASSVIDQLTATRSPPPPIQQPESHASSPTRRERSRPQSRSAQQRQLHSGARPGKTLAGNKVSMVAKIFQRAVFVL